MKSYREQLFAVLIVASLLAVGPLFGQTPSPPNSPTAGSGSGNGPSSTRDAVEQPGGAIEGTIVYQADPQRPWRLGRYYIRNAKSGELAEAVVGLHFRGTERSRVRDAIKASPSRTMVVDQKDFQFIPETIAIRAGDKVRFLNSDNHAHNVKTTHPDHSFNVTMPVGGEHVETFSVAPGITQPLLVDCVFHSAMRSWIFVFDHPWYQVTGKDGRFRLEGIPPGEYRIDVVHPAGELRDKQTVRVVAGQTTQLQFTLKPGSKE